MKLLLQTDTTGLPLLKRPVDDERQPYCTRLMLRVLDDNLKSVGMYDAITRPDGWTISDEAARVSGITTDMALSCGVRAGVSVVVLQDFLKNVDSIYSFNFRFHEKVVKSMFHRVGKVLDLSNHACYDLSESYRHHINLPATDAMLQAGDTSPKMPSLNEVYRVATGFTRSDGLLSVDAMQIIMQDMPLERYHNVNDSVGRMVNGRKRF